jgi:ProP effector
MSNASLKEQLQAVASQLSDKDKLGKEQKHKRKFHSPAEKVKKPKPKWLDYVQYGVELLRAYFPACFKSTNEMSPLKKGIKQDLVIRLSTLDKIVTEDKACMVKSLAYYVNTMAYHKSVVEGATRIDLDGHPADVVSAEEATYSVTRQQAKLQAKANAALSPVSQVENKMI